MTVVKNCLISFCVKSSNHFFVQSNRNNRPCFPWIFNFLSENPARILHKPVAIEEVTIFCHVRTISKRRLPGIDGGGKPNQTTIVVFQPQSVGYFVACCANLPILKWRVFVGRFNFLCGGIFFWHACLGAILDIHFWR